MTLCDITTVSTFPQAKNCQNIVNTSCQTIHAHLLLIHFDVPPTYFKQLLKKP